MCIVHTFVHTCVHAYTCTCVPYHYHYCLGLFGSAYDVVMVAIVVA